MVLGVLEEEGGGGCFSPSGGSRRHLQQLRERSRGQARLLLAARRRIRDQSDLSTKIHSERDSNLRNINSQLLLLESNLRRRQEELATMLREKDLTIRNQQHLILALASAYSQVTGQTEILKVLTSTSKEDQHEDMHKILKEILARVQPLRENYTTSKQRPNNITSSNEIKNSERNVLNDLDDNNKENVPKNNINTNGIGNKDSVDNKRNQSKDKEHIELENLPSNKIIPDDTTILSDSILTSLDKKEDIDSVTDTDSAIMLEDTCSDSLVILPFLKDGVKVIRSVSDALDCSARLSLSVSNTGGGDIDFCDITPVNSPVTTPRQDNNKDVSRNNNNNDNYSYRSITSSINTSPFSSSNEDSDGSPVCTLSKIRSSSSLQSVVDTETEETNDDNPEGRDKNPLSRSQSGNGQFVLPNIIEQSLMGNNYEVGEINDKNGDNVPPLQENQLQNSNLASSLNFDNDTIIDSECLSSVPSDSDVTISDGETDEDDVMEDDIEENILIATNTNDRRLLLGSYEKLNDIDLIRPRTYKKKPDELIQVTYNRVMSNHRSVTKVKDVKYRRINKAKSRSLEELRGKLRTHEGKPLISISIGHSYA